MTYYASEKTKMHPKKPTKTTENQSTPQPPHPRKKPENTIKHLPPTPQKNPTKNKPQKSYSKAPYNTLFR